MMVLVLMQGQRVAILRLELLTSGCRASSFSVCSRTTFATAAAGFSPSDEPITDACVIGAGYAGLSAARELTKAKRSVILLEAASRIGGRALDHQWPSGAVTELGVEFLGHRSDAPATYKLFVDELKLSIYSHGAFVANASFWRGASRARYGCFAPALQQARDLTAWLFVQLRISRFEKRGELLAVMEQVANLAIEHLVSPRERSAGHRVLRHHLRLRQACGTRHSTLMQASRQPQEFCAARSTWSTSREAASGRPTTKPHLRGSTALTA